MNVRTHTFGLRLQRDQLEEAIAAIFHTILFHRSLGKFRLIDDTAYVAGTLGYREVDCAAIDLTYIRCSSPTLERTVCNQIGCFAQQLCCSSGTLGNSGQLQLEFYQRRRKRWSYNHTGGIPWEIWTVQLELVELRDEADRGELRDSLGDTLRETICSIAELMGRNDYVPEVPCRTDLDAVYDTSYPDVQPYLFQFRATNSMSSGFGTSVEKTLQKLMR
ncbi:autophagy-related protein 101-like [Anopheles bellator]|uniref:autophagy-related protein 101-like n=1 Tax=Anopheles bellator TaxID=139047 RepID=UPI002648D461|nr:autophagy-related protein 101-like [Anopheles bellator]